MYSFKPNSYEKISIYLFNLIENLNESSKFIDGIIDELLMVSKFNKNGAFLNFINYFNSASFTILKCEGYLKCIIDCNFYTSSILNYLINQLNISISEFHRSFIYIDTIKTNYKALINEDLEKLMKEINNFSHTLLVIKDILNLYNPTC